MNVNRGKAMNIQLASIEMDVSIQCRATIDTAVVNEYAEAMNEGDKFPPVVLFGDKTKCWIGDGWHRIMAARQVGAEDIAADLRNCGLAWHLQAGLTGLALYVARKCPRCDILPASLRRSKRPAPSAVPATITIEPPKEQIT